MKLPSPLLLLDVTTNMLYIRVDDLPGFLSLHLGAKMARDAFFISAIFSQAERDSC